MPKVTVDDGVKINYCLDDFTNPWEEVKDTILIQQGAGEHLKYYAPVVPLLARKYRVLRFDARGRGESTAPPEEATLSGAATDDSPTAIGERCVKDVLCLMDHLGLEKVHFLGNASGGWVGIQCAVAHPDRVKSLILCSAPYKYTPDRALPRALGEKDTAAALKKFGVSAWLEQTKSVAASVNFVKSGAQLANWDVAERRKIPTHVYSRFYKWVARIDYTEWLPKIKCPTLIMVTARGRVTLEQQRFMEQHIPNAKACVFPDAGDRIHVHMPERYAEAILDFLGSIG